jgi:hypothetical protein
LAFRLLEYVLFLPAKICLFLSIPLFVLLVSGLPLNRRWAWFMGVAVFSANVLILSYDLVDEFRFRFIHVYFENGLEVLLHWTFLALYAFAALCCLLALHREPLPASQN